MNRFTSFVISSPAKLVSPFTSCLGLTYHPWEIYDGNLQEKRLVQLTWSSRQYFQFSQLVRYMIGTVIFAETVQQLNYLSHGLCVEI
jgi:hypothetical protein